MNVSKDFEELFASLNARRVKALVVGAYAVAFHAKPRFTKDIDIFVEPAPENAERLLEALADFRFGSVGLPVEDFTQSGRIIQLGYPPNRIDILTSIQGVTFEAAWAGRAEGLYGSQTVYYLGKAELVRNKPAVGRPQDQMDLRWLV